MNTKTLIQPFYKLSTEQSETNKAGLTEIKNGKFSTNEEVISEMKQWLTK